MSNFISKVGGGVVLRGDFLIFFLDSWVLLSIMISLLYYFWVNLGNIEGKLVRFVLVFFVLVLWLFLWFIWILVVMFWFWIFFFLVNLKFLGKLINL